MSSLQWRYSTAMNIAVCVKQVPDTTELRIDSETNTLIREGVEAVLNPLDAFPIETGLRLRNALGGKLTVFTMGPPRAADVLRTAVAMGADRMVLLSDRAFAGSDTWATSLALAQAIRAQGPFDLVLCGKQAIDGDTAQVGPGIAAHLRIPQITYVSDVDVENCTDEAVVVTRMLDDREVRLRVTLPAVLTVLKEANEPRLPSLAGRIRAIRGSATVLGAGQLSLPAEQSGLEGSPTRVVRIQVPETSRQHLRIQGDSAACARRLAGILPDLLNAAPSSPRPAAVPAEEVGAQ